jgi:hypothetical protein
MVSVLDGRLTEVITGGTGSPIDTVDIETIPPPMLKPIKLPSNAFTQ